MDNCIICNSKIVHRCKCLRSDKLCENGHEYHYGSNREIHQGISNHGSEICCVNLIIIKPITEIVKE